MDGAELAVRFSFITNKLRLCGPEEGNKVFLRYLEKRDNRQEVLDSIKKFEGLYPYLSAIAEKHGKELLDKEVVEAYWIGNNLLDDFTSEDMKKIILHLTKRGLPKSIAETRIKKLPQGMVPHHNFNVYYVGVGNTSGTVPVTLQNMDNCRISSGKVIDFVHGNLLVKTNSLVFDGKYSKKEDVKTIQYMPEYLDAKKGDTIAIHWGFAVMALNEAQRNNLERYDERILEKINNSVTWQV